MDNKHQSFKMKETPTSLAVYFVIVGIIGLLPIVSVPVLFYSSPILAIASIIGVILGAVFLVSGIRIKRTLKDPKVILSVLYAEAVLLLLDVVYRLATNYRVGWISFAVSILITIYLIYSVKHLSKMEDKHDAVQTENDMSSTHNPE